MRIDRWLIAVGLLFAVMSVLVKSEKACRIFILCAYGMLGLLMYFLWG